ncbi:MAG: methylaspartate mutase subunit S [Candidatus Brocadiia bacterium]
MTEPEPVVVLGVIGSDCHAVGNRLLERKLREEGFDVVNLGVMVEQEEFVEAAQEHGADAILVSSLYGHGRIDCEGLPDKCEENGLGHIPLYVGGNLNVGAGDFSEVRKMFEEMGFDRIFPADCDLDRAIETLRRDIEDRGRDEDQQVNTRDRNGRDNCDLTS